MLVQVDVESAPAESPPTAQKVCLHCDRLQPLTEFRRLHKDSDIRRSVCRACRNRQKREHAQAGNNEALRYFEDKVAIAGTWRDAEIAVGLMLAHFGGVKAFVRTWHSPLKEALAQGKSDDALRAMSTVVQLLALGRKS